MAGVQERLLGHAVGLLAPGGRLVYCTCSLEPEEGEDRVEALIAGGASVSRAPVDLSRVGAPADSSPPPAICAPCPATGRTRTRAWEGWMVFSSAF